MTSVSVVCPNCKKTLSVAGNAYGKVGNCPNCGKAVRFPIDVAGPQKPPPHANTSVASNTDSRSVAFSSQANVFSMAAIATSILAMLIVLISSLTSGTPTTERMGALDDPNVATRLDSMAEVIKRQEIDNQSKTQTIQKLETDIQAAQNTISKFDESLLRLSSRLDSIDKEVSQLASASTPDAKSIYSNIRTDVIDIVSKMISKRVDSGLLATGNTIAYLDPTSKAYSSLNISQGTLLISVEDAEPYLDGVRLHLKIGNPMAIDFRGYELDLTWGERFDGDLSKLDFGDPLDAEKYDKYRESLQSKVYRLSDTLRSGYWNKCEVVLSDTEPGSLHQLEVKISTSTVSLVLPSE